MLFPVPHIAPIAAPRRGAAAVSTLYTDLVVYHKHEEASGTRIDATGRGNDLAPNAAPGRGTGKVDFGSTYVIASSQYLSNASTADLTAGDFDWTWAGWFNPTAVGIADQFIIAKGTFFIDYEIFVTGSALQFQFWNGAYSIAFTATGTITAGAWHRFVAWHNASANTINLKLNNSATVTVATSSAGVGTANLFTIGRRASGGGFFGGTIDETGFWKRLLTAAEIDEHWNGGAGITLF